MLFFNYGNAFLSRIMETLHFVQSDIHLLRHSHERSDEESLPGSLRNRIYETAY